MHPAIVGASFEIVFHLRRLRVFAKPRIVISGPRRFHGANRDAIDTLGQQAGADQPIGFVGGLLEFPLLGQRAEDVRE